MHDRCDGGSPKPLLRKGWTYSTPKIGERVTAAVHPLTSGVAGGSQLTSTLENGAKFTDGLSDDKA